MRTTSDHPYVLRAGAGQVARRQEHFEKNFRPSRSSQLRSELELGRWFYKQEGLLGFGFLKNRAQETS